MLWRKSNICELNLAARSSSYATPRSRRRSVLVSAASFPCVAPWAASCSALGLSEESWAFCRVLPLRRGHRSPGHGHHRRPEREPFRRDLGTHSHQRSYGAAVPGDGLAGRLGQAHIVPRPFSKWPRPAPIVQAVQSPCGIAASMPQGSVQNVLIGVQHVQRFKRSRFTLVP